MLVFFISSWLASFLHSLWLVRFELNVDNPKTTNIYIPKTRSPKTSATLIQNNVYFFFITIFRLAIPAFRQPFRNSCIRKGSDFTSLSILKGREICYLGLLKGPIGLIDEWNGFEKSSKRSVFEISSLLTDSLLPLQKSVERGWQNVNRRGFIDHQCKEVGTKVK